MYSWYVIDGKVPAISSAVRNPIGGVSTHHPPANGRPASVSFRLLPSFVWRLTFHSSPLNLTLPYLLASSL
jgi:hypothetical protein